MLVHNPFFKKIQLAKKGQPSASYVGVALKSLWFWLLCFIGAALYKFMPLTVEGIPLLCAGLVIAIVCPFLSYWFPATTMITGSLYSVVQGFLLALICHDFIAEYDSLIWIAVGVTASVFFIILILYGSGIVKVNHKFRTVLLALFLLSILGSSVIFISSFFTSSLTNLFWGNSSIAIAVAFGTLLLAIINLVFEFDFTVKLIKKGACKKYEWIAAYGLFMTVVMIFLRVLELLSRFIDKKEH